MKKEIDFDLRKSLIDIQGASRDWIFNQYDQRVGAQTVMDCSYPVGAVRLPESGRTVSVALGCRPTLMDLHPVLGGKDSVLYPCLQLAVRGYEPWAVTDCLNFGNPKKKNIMSEFVSSLEAMNEVCEAFEAPIISGNVSLFNETEGKNITSTPATAVLGLNPKVIETKEEIISDTFVSEETEVYLLDCEQMIWSGYWGAKDKSAPWGKGEIDIEEVKKFSDQLYHLAHSGDLLSARVVGKFGLAYTLSKMISEDRGIECTTDFSKNKFFEERLYQVVVEVKNRKSLEGFQFSLLGKTDSSSCLDLKFDKINHQEVKSLMDSGWEKEFGFS